MDDTILKFDPEQKEQTLNITISPDGNLLNLKITLRYMAAPNKWFMTAQDDETGKFYFSNIPLVGSTDKVWIDLIRPFRYKNIGDIVCLPNTKNPPTADPEENTLGDFSVVWSDQR